ncbi:MAG: DUF1844 domain-containing protein [Ignavibacteria bacterium]|nr:DUF1844 domain-containing protein [Ignavibacteria bacterium]
MDKDKLSQLFFTLVSNYQLQTMVMLGKLTNPGTDKIEKNLELAEYFIDTLEMISEKTKGNLSEDEQRFLNETLTNLRLNYIEEKEKPPVNQKEENLSSETPKQE